MANEKDELPSLDSLDERIKQVRQSVDEPHGIAQPGKGKSQVLRGGTEILAGVGVGAFIGYFLDDHLGTRPWGLIVLVLLGFAGGVMNLYRAVAQESQTSTDETNPAGTKGSRPKDENAGE